MSEATPRPWGQVSVGGKRYISATDNGNETLVGMLFMPEKARANAGLIVRAVNSHDALVEALEWLVNVGCGVGRAGGAPEEGEFEAAIEAGKVALAKAKEA